MTTFDEINNILHEDFKCKNFVFEEETNGMKVEIDNSGCKCAIYKYDKNLNKQYKGGLFPFFAKTKGVCSISDYIVFAEKNHKLYCLLVELKRGRSSTFPQLKASKEFVKFIINTLNRVYNKSYSPIIRLISIHEIRLRKKSTQERMIKYDENSHHDVKSNKFVIKYFLI